MNPFHELAPTQIARWGAGTLIRPGTVIEFAGKRQVLVNGVIEPPDPRMLKMQEALELILKKAQSDDMGEAVFYEIAMAALA